MAEEVASSTIGSDPVYTVVGALVALGPLHRGLIDLWVRWLNDPETTRTLGNVGVFTREMEERYFDQRAADASSTEFAIYGRATSRPIGSTGLKEINLRTGSATFGIMIGDPAYRNRGFGTEATRLVLDYAFHALGLHNVLLNVFSHNPRGKRAYEKAGFKEIGRRRESYRLGQRRYDTVIMHALATDFVSPVLEQLLHDPQSAKPAQDPPMIP